MEGNRSITPQFASDYGLSLHQFWISCDNILCCVADFSNKALQCYYCVSLGLCCMTDSSHRVGVTVARAGSYRWSSDSLDQRGIRSIDREQDRRAL